MLDSRNHGNHENDENHENPGCKSLVPQTTGLEIPDPRPSDFSLQAVGQAISALWIMLGFARQGQGGFQVRWFWQRFPCTEIPSRKSFPAMLPWQERPIRVLIFLESWTPRNPERGHIRQNRSPARQPKLLSYRCREGAEYHSAATIEVSQRGVPLAQN